MEAFDVQKNFARWCIVMLNDRTGRTGDIRSGAQHIPAPTDTSFPKTGFGGLLDTIERANQLSDDRRIILSIPVSRADRTRATELVNPVVVSVRPNRLGTGVALVRCLVKVAQSDRDALVCLMPEYGQVSNEKRLVSQIQKATAWVERYPDDVVVVGRRPRRPKWHRWWILGAREAIAHIWPSRGRLVTPDTDEEAEDLLDKGLLSMGIVVFRARAMLELFRDAVTSLAKETKKPERNECVPLSDVLAYDPKLDLWGDILSLSGCRLHVISVPNLFVERGSCGSNLPIRKRPSVGERVWPVFKKDPARE